MNYLCHGRNSLDRPYELVGTVLPDWIRILDRTARLRPWMVDEAPRIDHSPRGAIEDGLRRHFEDDAWFHSTPIFREVTAEIAEEIRAVYPDHPDRRMRASFYAHLLVEMLLDAWLLEQEPGAAQAFAFAIRSLDREKVVKLSNEITPHPVAGLPGIVVRFTDPAVLEAYADEEVVSARLNRMGRIVHQPDLPREFVTLIAPARVLVRRHGEALLTRPCASSKGEETRREVQ